MNLRSINNTLQIIYQFIKLEKYLAVILCICINASAHFQPDAEKYISKILERKTPYQRTVLGEKFVISSVHSYPPDRITAMFVQYLLENNLIKNKVVADIGARCFALGILAVKNGASLSIGTDISDYALACARENIKLHGVEDKVILLQGAEMQAILQEFKGKADVIVAGTPWDTISTKQYDTLNDSRKPISRSFYDIDNKLIKSILTQSKKLLTPNGKIFISSAKNKIERIKELCQAHKAEFKIVSKNDIHKNGNTHYILEIILKG
jgi:release factor glutamine methyltransferase